MAFLLRRAAVLCPPGKACAGLLIWAVLILSFVCFWPGIVMTDTMARWAGAYTIVGKLDIKWALELWLAPTMTWFMVPFAATEFGSPFFLGTQIAYLMFGCAAWIGFSSSERPWWIAIVFMIPLVFAYSSFVVPDVWTLAAMLVLVGCFFALERSLVGLPVICFFFSCLVLFGFRQNSLVLVPIVWFFVAKLRGPSRRLKAGLLALTVAALSTLHFVPALLGFEGPDSSAAAPAWELVGAIKVAREGGVILDPSIGLHGIADTEKAVSQHSFVTIDSLLWGAKAPIPPAVIMRESAEIQRRWLSMIVNHPTVYAKTKLRIYKCMLGLCEGYLQTAIGCEAPWPQLQGRLTTCLTDGGGAPKLEILNRIQASLLILLLPVLWVPVSVLVLTLSWKEYSRYDRILIVLATAYLGSFFVLNQAASFRYLFPSYVVFTAYQIRFFLSLASMRKILKRRQGLTGSRERE